MSGCRPLRLAFHCFFQYDSMTHPIPNLFLECSESAWTNQDEAGKRKSACVGDAIHTPGVPLRPANAFLDPTSKSFPKSLMLFGSQFLNDLGQLRRSVAVLTPKSETTQRIVSFYVAGIKDPGFFKVSRV